ncbi:Hypothetical predicted protein [Pelobates cultripes]|uniref:Uncharacterized protein n=1 Tax=Pelobates cultripes TaxID=61616 RepID=A0AAD1VSB6_PELCU|nr:Hypothetical predicted protein [Pelobates cultripes]
MSSGCMESLTIRSLSPHSPTSRSHAASLTHSTRRPCQSTTPQAEQSVQSLTPTTHVHANSSPVRTNATYLIQKEELHTYERHLCSCERYSPILQTKLRLCGHRLPNTARTEVCS